MFDLPATSRPSNSLARVTGLQAAQLSLASQLHSWAEQFSPREYETLLETHGLFVAREHRRLELVREPQPLAIRLQASVDRASRGGSRKAYRRLKPRVKEMAA